MATLTKKHFNRLAHAVSLVGNKSDRYIVAQEIADMCAEENYLFDRRRFYDACHAEPECGNCYSGQRASECTCRLLRDQGDTRPYHDPYLADRSPALLG